MDLETLRLKLAVDASEWSTGLAAASTSLGGFTRSVEGALGPLTGKLGKITAGVAGIGFAVAGLASSIGPAIEFESAFAGVLKTVDGSKQQLDDIRDGILGMSKVMPTAATDLAAIAESAGQLGIAAPDVLEFTETVAMLGETTDLSFDEAATSLAQFINVTGSPASTISELADVIVDLGNNSATTESKIVNFGQRLAGAGAQIGLADAEILGIATAFSSVGIEAEAGGTAVSRVLKEMGQAAIQEGPQLERFAEVAGMTAEEFKRMVDNDPAEAFTAFIDGLGEISNNGGDVVGVLDDMGLKGERVQDALLRASANSDLLSGSIERANEAYGNGAAQDEFNKRLETTEAKLSLVKNTIQDVLIAIGDNFLGAIADGAMLAIEGIDFLVEAFTPLVEAIVDFGAAAVQPIADFAEAIGGPLMSAGVGFLIGALEVLTGFVEIITPLAPIVGVVGGLAAAFAVLGPAALTASGGIAGIGLSAPIATTGLAGMASAAAPLVAVGGPLVLLGKALLDAKDRAKEAGDAFRTGFADAIADADFGTLVDDLDEINERMVELREIDKVDSGFGGGWESWGTALESAIQVMTPFTENTIVNARAELEELENVLENTAVDNYAAGIEALADKYGLAEDEIIGFVEEMGLHNEVVELGARQHGDLDSAVRNAYEGYGLAGEALAEYVAAQDQLEEATGQSIDSLDEQRAAIDGLIAAWDDLEAALGRVEERQNALNEATKGAEAALGEFNAAIAEQDVEYAAIAMGEYVKQLAATGDIDGAIAAQRDMRATIEELGEEMGLADEYVQDLLISYGLLTESEIADIGVEGQETIEYAIELIAELKYGLDAATAEAYIMELAADLGTTEEDFGRAFALGEEWAIAVFEAKLAANDVEALGSIQNAADAGEQWAVEYLATLAVQDNAAAVIVQAIAAGEQWAIDYVATLSANEADALVRIGVATLAANGYAIEYTATLGAIDGASAGIAVAQGNANAFATGYDATLTATDQASAVVAVARGAATGFATGYNGTLTATDSASATIAVARGAAQGFAGTYTARLVAIDAASGVAAGAKAAVAGFAGTSVRTLVTNNVTNNTTTNTIRTVRTGGTNTYRADGGIDYPGEFLANGGIRQPERFAHIAQAGSWKRIYGEPETGGEAFIPLGAHKIHQAVPVLDKAASILGFDLVPQGAGTPTAVSVRPTLSMQVGIDAGGQTDPAVIEAAARSAAEAAVAEFSGRLTRELALAR